MGNTELPNILTLKFKNPPQWVIIFYQNGGLTTVDFNNTLQSSLKIGSIF